MLTVLIPGGEALALEHLVLDFNGTLAVEGVLIPGVAERLRLLADRIQVHVLTADTFGAARTALAGLPCTLVVVPPGGQDTAKLDYVNSLDAAKTVCVGNGRVDTLMLRSAALGIAVIEGEGAATEAIMAADVVTLGILPALDVLLNPLRLVATLRR